MSLEDELLALAGEGSEDDVKMESSPRAPSASPKKRARVPSARGGRKKARHDSDDDDDDLKDDDSDALSDPESNTRSEHSDHAAMDMDSDSEDEEDEDADQSLYPLDGKYKDHDDKEKLLAMTEVAREAVLAERMTQIEREQQDRHLRNLLKSRKTADKAKNDASAASTRKSLRTKSAVKNTEEATKRGKLDELRRNREERRATGRRSSFDDVDASRKMRSDDEDDHHYRPEVRVRDDRPIGLDDVNKCRIGRTALAKLCDYPGFDEVIPDIFVRVSMFDKESNRTVYRMAQVKGFTTGKVYNMLDGKRSTAQYLRVLHGKAERDFPMDMMSDSRFTEQEFNRFKNQLEIDKIPLPLVSHLEAKAQSLTALANRTLNDVEINAIVAKRRVHRLDVVEAAVKRSSFQIERQAAIEAGNEAEVARLDREIQAFDDNSTAVKRAESQMQRMARINAENRKRNQAEVRRAEILEKRAHREALAHASKTGGNFANPFMRVKTMVKFRHDVGDEKKEAEAKEEKKEVPLPVVVPKGRNRGVDDVIANMDLGIDIDIDI